jgi:hypothetical protein
VSAPAEHWTPPSVTRGEATGGGPCVAEPDLDDDSAPSRHITPITFCYVCEQAGLFREVDYDCDWLIFDTPVGSYEIHVCDEHYENMPQLPNSALAVVERCVAHPVVHGTS